MWIEILEVVICLLAVYGVYALLCRCLSVVFRRGAYSVALRLRREELSSPAVSDMIREAQLMTDSKNGRLLPPVILLEKQPTAEELTRLREYGCPIYCKKE